MRLRSLLLCLIVWHFCRLVGSAAIPTYRGDPDYLIDTWETEDGLPGNSATALTQTADGYLWFGTSNGLVRFDGVQCTVSHRDNTPGLPGHGIVNLHLDRRGRMWVSTYEGVAVRDGTWRTFGKADGLVGDYVRTFSERKDGALLLTMFDGNILEYHDGRFKSLPRPGERSAGYFGGVDEEGRWWVVQNQFIGRWNGTSWERMISPPALGGSEVGCAKARDGGLWLFLGKDLIKLQDGKETRRQTVAGFIGGVWSLSEDSRGNVWICTGEAGLFRVTPSGAVRHWTTANGLSYVSLRCVFEDRERNLWVGTNGGGLQRFRPRRVQAVTPEQGLTERNVRAVSAAADGGAWLATYGSGLFRAEQDRVTRVPLAPSE